MTVPYSEVRVLQGLALAGVIATCTDTRADPPGLPSLVGLEEPSQACYGRTAGAGEPGCREAIASR